MENFGECDHNLDHNPIVQCIKPIALLVENWRAEAITWLQFAFECTDWSVFSESAVNFNELIKSVVQYMKFWQITVSYQSIAKFTSITSHGLLNIL